ncbi:hypothetical protein CTEN210_01502 [Chaetoceros tenuissimus]|uniref:Uncharacterized protein n=1 Tax=Chaetoceros tenuissimus TaxID=426638 RepID=A0AAD3CG56_9STRA|nr:hypothetical protein CTEN210_01502 [Chaetoceros tenuissimus]
MGGNISRLHSIRKNYLIKLYNNGQASWDNAFEECIKLTASDLHDIFDSVSHGTYEIFDNIQQKYFPSGIPTKTIRDFLVSGRLPQNLVEKQKSLNVISSDVTSSTENRPNPSEVTSQKSGSYGTIWKKHEISITEKIVEHVTIDENGETSVLIESDKSRNDVIHIECESGMYAHRELTQQEQTEEMNKEMVTFLRASEEYVHLKNEDDEFEFMHSEVPDQGGEDSFSDDDSIM